ncbi:hypothetical protein C8P66_109144 [Humitalea rosea]|uniref:Subunit length determinant protein n=2 Tax=Humitalea rosea TaxID=990373 RepID=A0A2W7IL19_9PROT|nr:hypothetical protein C8P66_109144 [Humitalea rosea]
MRLWLLALILIGYTGAASLVLAWPRSYVASAVVAPAESTGLAVSTLIATLSLSQGGAGLFDTRPTGNFAIYLSALRSPEAAAMLAAETTILADITRRRGDGFAGRVRDALGLRMQADRDDVQTYLERRLAVTQSLVATTWNLDLQYPDRDVALDLLVRLHDFAEAHVRAGLAGLVERRLSVLEARAATERDVFQRVPLYELVAQHQRALAVLRSDETVAARMVSAPVVEIRPSIPNRSLLLLLLAVALPMAVLVGAACLVLLRTPPAPQPLPSR